MDKFPRTYHYPFSPGTTSDDKVAPDYFSSIRDGYKWMHTEKLDGENTCLKRFGVFARSHVAPTRNPWANNLKQKWATIKNDLGDLEIFGENLYGIHSIEYTNLPQHFFVIRVKHLDKFLSWEESKFYAYAFDFPMVPILENNVDIRHEGYFQRRIEELVKQNSNFDSIDAVTKQPCSMEGLVTVNVDEFDESQFNVNAFKWVRKGHVKTDEHWSKNWERAKLNYE